ncbi:MAG: bifunctional oligoribonuclease/PAP phosphatase NrnA [Anaerolineae bacterium]|nr:bifunctional oligoribonuclease/PAP phosphatase NrnA [Anaerolineae bacterium]
MSHMAPDGDAIGSLLSLGHVMRALGKQVRMACQDPLPQRFDYLPGFHDVVRGAPAGPFDLLVSLDCSDTERMGTVFTALDDLPPILNIDHHVTNLQFGAVNLVDVEAVSTTHVLYHLINHIGVRIDPGIAACLLTGLVTDTRGFRTFNVTPEVLLIAVELMRAGASLAMITQNGLDRRSPETLRLWGVGFARLKVGDGLVWSSIPLAAQQHPNGDDSTSGLTNTLIGVEGALMAALFVERKDGRVEVGLRAIPGFDVAQIALSLGGGGHTLASGCLVPGPFESAQARVVALLKEELARQREEP